MKPPRLRPPLALAALAALPSLNARAALPADAALRALESRCNDDERALPDRLRLTFAAGAERAAAVDALSKHLGAAVQRYDVAALTDKYIGETEKNLERVAAPEPARSWVLFFDEADALFSVRTPTQEALLKTLGKIAAGRVVVLGLRERPPVGRLGTHPLGALPAPTTSPWAAVCGPRD